MTVRFLWNLADVLLNLTNLIKPTTGISLSKGLMNVLYFIWCDYLFLLYVPVPMKI